VIKIIWWIWALIIIGILIVWIAITSSLNSGISEGSIGNKIMSTWKYLCCGGRK